VRTRTAESWCPRAPEATPARRSRQPFTRPSAGSSIPTRCTGTPIFQRGSPQGLLPAWSSTSFPDRLQPGQAGGRPVAAWGDPPEGGSAATANRWWAPRKRRLDHREIITLNHPQKTAPSKNCLLSRLRSRRQTSRRRLESSPSLLTGGRRPNRGNPGQVLRAGKPAQGSVAALRAAADRGRLPMLPVAFGYRKHRIGPHLTNLKRSFGNGTCH